MKEIIVLGAIGNTARQDRDNFRVFSRGGVIGAIRSRDYKGSQLVVKRWKRRSPNWGKHQQSEVRRDMFTNRQDCFQHL